MQNKYSVTSEYTGERVDRFLVIQDIGLSRSAIQKAIKAGNVTVNGEQVSKHHFLKNGDSVVVSSSSDSDTEIQKIAIDIPVLFEDEAILVIEKPCGVLVHPATNASEWTLVDFLREKVTDIHEVGDDPSRAGIVHRLDRDVSGVMVLTKTQDAFLSMKEQFANRSVHKEYKALVHGIPEPLFGNIRLPISRSKTHPGKMAAHPRTTGDSQREEGLHTGKEAWTIYETTKEHNTRYADVDIQIKTGRTHQIRVHMLAIGHPIVGDTLYSIKKYGDREYDRLYLHSYKLGFIHPITGENIEYISELPESFEQFFQKA